MSAHKEFGTIFPGAVRCRVTISQMVLIACLKWRLIMDSRKILSGLAFGVVLGICAVLFSWFAGSESSPLHEFFLHNVTLKNIWMLLNFPAYMALVVTGARSFEVGLVMI